MKSIDSTAFKVVQWMKNFFQIQIYLIIDIYLYYTIKNEYYFNIKEINLIIKYNNKYQ